MKCYRQRIECSVYCKEDRDGENIIGGVQKDDFHHTHNLKWIWWYDSILEEN